MLRFRECRVAYPLHVFSNSGKGERSLGAKGGLIRERRELLYTSRVLAATGKRLGLSDMGAVENRVFLYVGKQKEEEGEDWEVEEEAAALLEEDILIGDWRCRRDCRGEVVKL